LDNKLLYKHDDLHHNKTNKKGLSKSTLEATRSAKTMPRERYCKETQRLSRHETFLSAAAKEKHFTKQRGTKTVLKVTSDSNKGQLQRRTRT